MINPLSPWGADDENVTESTGTQSVAEQQREETREVGTNIGDAPNSIAYGTSKPYNVKVTIKGGEIKSE